MPLNVTCWPSISPAEAVVSLDYDLAVDFDLQNVVIAIPCPSHPRINQARPPAACYHMCSTLVHAKIRVGVMSETRHL